MATVVLQRQKTRPYMSADVDTYDRAVREHMDAIQVLIHANVLVLLCSDADAEPFAIVRPGLDEGSAKRLFRLFASTRWNASKSL